jgi:hypothetical protein
MGKFVPHAEYANREWKLWLDDDNKFSQETVQCAILMDIRAELQRMNNILQCPNFVEIPSILRRVERNTKKRKKVVAKGKPKLRVVS